MTQHVLDMKKYILQILGDWKYDVYGCYENHKDMILLATIRYPHTIFQEYELNDITDTLKKEYLTHNRIRYDYVHVDIRMKALNGGRYKKFNYNKYYQEYIKQKEENTDVK